jgi:hypothetical protein
MSPITMTASVVIENKRRHTVNLEFETIYSFKFSQRKGESL